MAPGKALLRLDREGGGGIRAMAGQNGGVTTLSASALLTDTEMGDEGQCRVAKWEEGLRRSLVTMPRCHRKARKVIVDHEINITAGPGRLVRSAADAGSAERHEPRKRSGGSSSGVRMGRLQYRAPEVPGPGQGTDGRRLATPLPGGSPPIFSPGCWRNASGKSSGQRRSSTGQRWEWLQLGGDGGGCPGWWFLLSKTALSIIFDDLERVPQSLAKKQR